MNINARILCFLNCDVLNLSDITLNDWIQWGCVAVIIILVLWRSVMGVVRFVRWSRRSRRAGDSSLPPCCGGNKSGDCCSNCPSCCGNPRNGDCGKACGKAVANRRPE